MHILFSEEEKKWIDTRTFGFPIKEGCPAKIRESINKKKAALDSQKDMVRKRNPNARR